MATKYIDYLLNASQWWLFFEKGKAIEKVTELARQGFEVKLHQERQQYTVFKMK